ncbi:MAG: LLM class flavin-dependent oxidoreductase [Dehalococcoidia bacterium]|nr:LLM class flavin-dependent oxidoreductase [Dehalococcoidia bacterium]
MEFGIGIDASLGLTLAEQRALVGEARDAGYASAWTPSGPATRDGFQVCGQWAAQGLPVGISVIPAPLWTVPSLAQQAGSLHEISDGRFTLGLGTGGIYGAEYRSTYGLPEWPVVTMMREYLGALRGLLAGETVTLEGKVVRLRGLRVTGRPLTVPLYLAALGPQMLRLAGEVADGVCLNWTAPGMRAGVRETIARGADRRGRDPSAIRVTEYIRVCIDEDEAKARRAFVRALMPYALARAGASKDHGYRGHFRRMGFDAALTHIEERRDAGAPAGELLDLFPEELLREVGYYGKTAGAPAALARLSQGLDLAVVRIVGAQPGIDAARAVLRACAPGAV